MIQSVITENERKFKMVYLEQIQDDLEETLANFPADTWKGRKMPGESLSELWTRFFRYKRLTDLHKGHFNGG